MSDGANKLSTFLIEKAEKEWSENKQDYHLARIDPDFRKMHNEDYRTYLGDFEKISEFARHVDEIYVNQDPKALARIGIRPIYAQNETQQKTANIQASKRHSSSGEYSRAEKSLIYFLRMLSELPEGELQKIDIPTSALAKLIKK